MFTSRQDFASLNRCQSIVVIFRNTTHWRSLRFREFPSREAPVLRRPQYLNEIGNSTSQAAKALLEVFTWNRMAFGLRPEEPHSGTSARLSSTSARIAHSVFSLKVEAQAHPDELMAQFGANTHILLKMIKNAGTESREDQCAIPEFHSTDLTSQTSQ